MPSPKPTNSLHFGTKVKAVFTIAGPKRYRSDMLFLLAAAAVASVPQDAPDTRTGAIVQARATVRIVRAVTLRLGEGPLSGDGPPARDTTAHADGASRPARLIEFQYFQWLRLWARPK